MKGYSAFHKALLETHHQMVLCLIQDARLGGGLIPLQRYSRCILQPQPTGQKLQERNYLKALKHTDIKYERKKILITLKADI